MRLINIDTLSLEEYVGDQIPEYAILSHCWRDGEVSYQDWQDSGHRSSKEGFRKILAACEVARRFSSNYLWVDTNCINKESSAELSEAINSMYPWYHRSTVCIAYLDDVDYFGKSYSPLRDSRWFTRGWTLQELLAPEQVHFFDVSWTEIGTRQSLLGELCDATRIEPEYLRQPESIRLSPVATRMSWAAKRSTTREEDMAYCLLGLFEVNMPLLYGEGKRAFIRLQEEIIRYSSEHTIFCWTWPPPGGSHEPTDWQGCFAPSPLAFRNATKYVPTPSIVWNMGDLAPEFRMTNRGLLITAPVIHTLTTTDLFVLDARETRRTDDIFSTEVWDIGEYSLVLFSGPYSIRAWTSENPEESELGTSLQIDLSCTRARSKPEAFSASNKSCKSSLAGAHVPVLHLVPIKMSLVILRIHFVL
jgi:hypothetical protein